MATIECIKIRAKICFCDMEIETPHILSFNVHRARGQMCATFSASVKFPAGESLDSVSKEIEIWVGEKDNINKIFTGYIHKITVNPSKTDPDYIILNMSGRDIMFRLEGQNFTRRIKATQMARFGAITAITVENEKHQERFPARITSNEERLTSHPILSAKGQIVRAPNPSFAPIDTSAVSGPIRFGVRNFGYR